jgi:UDP-glucose:(heptosyl)LPS alpha-1,3-glucosyltransferase
MMRISYFLPKCTTDNSHGRYVIELSTRLSTEHQVTVYAGAFWSSLTPSVQRRFLTVPNRPALARLAMLWATSLLRGKRELADIVHVQGADAPIGNVVTAHYCCAVQWGSGERGIARRLNDKIGAIAERYSLSKPSTRRVIAVSQQVKADIEREYGVDRRRISVIPNGVDLQAFNPGSRDRWRKTIRESLGFAPKEFVVLFVGGDYRRKGLVVLLKAIAQVRPVCRVLTVGVELDRSLKDFIRKRGLSHVVRFHDSTENLAPLYAAADCFALPTLYDTFSMAALEAMASGLPVIISRRAGLTEVMSPDRDCLVLEDPRDVENLTRTLQDLVGDEDLQSSLGVEARRTAERYSWEAVARDTVAVYMDALSSF